MRASIDKGEVGQEAKRHVNAHDSSRVFDIGLILALRCIKSVLVRGGNSDIEE